MIDNALEGEGAAEAADMAPTDVPLDPQAAEEMCREVDEGLRKVNTMMNQNVTLNMTLNITPSVTWS